MITNRQFYPCWFLRIYYSCDDGTLVFKEMHALLHEFIVLLSLDSLRDVFISSLVVDWRFKKEICFRSDFGLDLYLISWRSSPFFKIFDFCLLF